MDTTQTQSLRWPHRRTDTQRSHRQHLFVVNILLPAALHYASSFGEMRNIGVHRQSIPSLASIWTLHRPIARIGHRRPETYCRHRPYRLIVVMLLSTALHCASRSDKMRNIGVLRQPTPSSGTIWTLHRPIARVGHTNARRPSAATGSIS
jgi:hypothetical protein